MGEKLVRFLGFILLLGFALISGEEPTDFDPGLSGIAAGNATTPRNMTTSANTTTPVNTTTTTTKKPTTLSPDMIELLREHCANQVSNKIVMPFDQPLIDSCFWADPKDTNCDACTICWHPFIDDSQSERSVHCLPALDWPSHCKGNVYYVTWFGRLACGLCHENCNECYGPGPDDCDACR
ncbi:unnamed protein product, partial [Mesorhabditis spiculigera]